MTNIPRGLNIGWEVDADLILEVWDKDCVEELIIF